MQKQIRSGRREEKGVEVERWRKWRGWDERVQIMKKKEKTEDLFSSIRHLSKSQVANNGNSSRQNYRKCCNRASHTKQWRSTHCKMLDTIIERM